MSLSIRKRMVVIRATGFALSAGDSHPPAEHIALEQTLRLKLERLNSSPSRGFNVFQAIVGEEDTPGCNAGPLDGQLKNARLGLHATGLVGKQSLLNHLQNGVVLDHEIEVKFIGIRQ